MVEAMLILPAEQELLEIRERLQLLELVAARAPQPELLLQVPLPDLHSKVLPLVLKHKFNNEQSGVLRGILGNAVHLHQQLHGNGGPQPPLRRKTQLVQAHLRPPQKGGHPHEHHLAPRPLLRSGHARAPM